MRMTPRFHNLLSYLGALVSLPLAAVLFRPEPLRPLVIALWVAHFARRSAEAAFVHRYGKPTFPLQDALIEYAYYWGFGVWIGLSRTSTSAPEWVTVLGVALFCAAELGNARAHWMLRSLRSTDPSARPIPRGFLFEWVSSPHYLFEILSWVGFYLVTRTLAAACFTALGAIILAFWGTQRHRAYRERFDGQAGRELYPSGRRALLPFVF
jgi:very-long-chain enoyl-CoA reductase